MEFDAPVFGTRMTNAVMTLFDGREIQASCEGPWLHKTFTYQIDGVTVAKLTKVREMIRKAESDGVLSKSDTEATKLLKAFVEAMGRVQPGGGVQIGAGGMVRLHRSFCHQKREGTKVDGETGVRRHSAGMLASARRWQNAYDPWLRQRRDTSDMQFGG